MQICLAANSSSLAKISNLYLAVSDVHPFKEQNPVLLNRNPFTMTQVHETVWFADIEDTIA